MFRGNRPRAGAGAGSSNGRGRPRVAALYVASSVHSGVPREADTFKGLKCGILPQAHSPRRAPVPRGATKSRH